MIVTSGKNLTEAYWDMVNKSSGKEPAQEVAAVESAIEMDAAAMPDFTPPEAESFCLDLTGRFTTWLRKYAD
ncbi:MAG: hypothetical protein Q8L80_01405 [Gallionella sp.]|nr:hypothetical protein [Gallionella sp.]MDP1942102.1 hypothetical protein [Gallionella sp.]